MYFNFSAVLLLLCCLSFQLELSAATLHAILVCDTDAFGIGPSVEADYDNILRCVKKIASQTGLKAKVSSFRQEKAQATFLKEVKKSKIRSDDVVLFYWSGHGYHSQFQEDVWPTLDFTYGEKMLSQYEITLEIMKKNPRLLISIADCCNAYTGYRFRPTAKIARAKASKKNYKKLFVNSRGVYIASGSSAGEYSFGLNEDYESWVPAGGFFTNAWLSALYDIASSSGSDPSWEKVFDAALQQTIDYQLNDPQDPAVHQHPQYQKLNG